jgi:hypothetical protein
MKLKRPNTWSAIVERKEIEQDYDIKMTDRKKKYRDILMILNVF